MTPIISVTDVTKTYGLQTVLNGVSLHLHSGARVGLVGANGAGKTTLLNIISGDIAPDSGSVMCASGVRLGYLRQTLAALDESTTLAALIDEALATLRQIEVRMRALEAQMAVGGADLDAILRAYGDLSDQFERAGGYAMEHQLDAIFAGLKIAHIERSRAAASLSGGEKARVGLALLLLSAPDALLLDEPTNHLDADSLAWLETYLTHYRGAQLIVSHDRQFLDRTVTAIVEIDEHSRQTRHYTGDYAAYLRAKTAALIQWRADYARQQEDMRELRLAVKVEARRNTNYRTHRDNDKFVPKFKSAGHDATVARRVHAAEEKLKRIEADPIPEPPGELRFQPVFDPAALDGQTPLRADGLTKHFGSRVVLDDVHFALEPRSRILITGDNGAGKSTLLRLLAGSEQPNAGAVYRHPAVRIGYLAQEDETLDPLLTVLETVQQSADLPEQALKALLMQTGLFRYDELARRIGDLSGGMRRKVQLAGLIASRANLLLLDEPTNSLSFAVLESFEAALRTFPGAVIAVSHDRRFIEQFDGQVWRLVGGRLAYETPAREW
jgi:macrolide transport system ATP-binding/permease protein